MARQVKKPASQWKVPLRLSPLNGQQRLTSKHVEKKALPCTPEHPGRHRGQRTVAIKDLCHQDLVEPSMLAEFLLDDESFDADDHWRFKRCCCGESYGSFMEAPQPEELSFSEDGKGRFSSGKWDDHKFHFALLNVVESVCGFSLIADDVILRELQLSFPKRDGPQGVLEGALIKAISAVAGITGLLKTMVGELGKRAPLAEHIGTPLAAKRLQQCHLEGRLHQMTRRAAHQTPQARDHIATARQAGLEKGLFDELGKGLSYAVKSLRARKEQEHLTLLCEAEIAYQNALCLVREAGIIPGSPIAQSLQHLGTFLQKTNTLQERN
jgi:hypothetical protein